MRDEGAGALREAFGFQPGDLAANRQGQLSPRQVAVLRAGRGAMRWSFAVFVLVMLGSAAFVALLSRNPALPGQAADSRLVGAIVLAAVLLVIAVGWALSRGAIAAAGGRQLRVAHGRAEAATPDAPPDACRLRLGTTVLELPSEVHRAAFAPGVEYRVYYLPGPRPLILSAEAVEAGPAPTPEESPAAMRRDTDAQLQTIRRGRVLVGGLGLLALGIPAAGWLAGQAPAPWARVVWPALFVLAVGFAAFAVRWLSPRR